jgi:hypothetical protein
LIVAAVRPVALWFAFRTAQAVLRDSPRALACSSSATKPEAARTAASSLILADCRTLQSIIEHGDVVRSQRAYLCTILTQSKSRVCSPSDIGTITNRVTGPGVRESLSCCAVGVSSFSPAALSQAPQAAANSALASSSVRTKPLNGPGPFCTPLRPQNHELPLGFPLVV